MTVAAQPGDKATGLGHQERLGKMLGRPPKELRGLPKELGGLPRELGGPGQLGTPNNREASEEAGWGPEAVVP